MNTVGRAQPVGSIVSGNGHQQATDEVADRNKNLQTEILAAIADVGAFGSIEIYIQDHKITQITTRRIQKTKHTLNGQR